MNARRIMLDTESLAAFGHHLADASEAVDVHGLAALSGTGSLRVNSASAEAVAYARGVFAVLRLDVESLGLASTTSADAVARADSTLAKQVGGTS